MSEFENNFAGIVEGAIREICGRIENKIDSWKVSEQDAQKNFDPPWTPEQTKWHNDGVDSVKNLIAAMREGDL